MSGSKFYYPPADLPTKGLALGWWMSQALTCFLLQTTDLNLHLSLEAPLFLAESLLRTNSSDFHGLGRQLAQVSG